MNKEELALYDNFYYKDGELYWKESIGKVGRRKTGSIAGSSKGNFYKRVRLNGKQYRCHRIIWFLHYGEWPKGEIDHIDRNKLNNHIENLRDVTRSENQINSEVDKRSKTGIKNICFNSSENVFLVQARRNGKLFHFGRFKKIEDAKAALSKVMEV